MGCGNCKDTKDLDSPRNVKHKKTKGENKKFK